MEVRPLSIDVSSVDSSSKSSEKVDAKSKRDAEAIASIANPEPRADSSSVNFQDLYKSLTITAKEIVDKINEKLSASLPDGVQSLKPEDVTPEATADRIVKGVVGLYSIYAKQNKGLEGEDLLISFIDTVKSGIDAGYSDAIGILENLGAFQYDGVREGLAKTRSLIDEKLAKFETEKRSELGLAPPKDAAPPKAPSPTEQVATA